MTGTGEQTGDGGGAEALVGEYALGLLDAVEHEQLARRITAEPGLAAELRLWRQRLSALDREFAEVSPPAGVLPRIEARLWGAEPAARSGWWNSLPLWRSLAGLGLAATLLALGFSLMQPARLDPAVFANQLVAALREEGSTVSLVALYNPATGTVRLTSLGGDPVPDRDFELWAIHGSEAPKSMGVIAVNQRSDIKVAPDVLVDFGAGTILAVTLEPKGGSPTGGPTGPIVAKGAATPI